MITMKKRFVRRMLKSAVAGLPDVKRAALFDIVRHISKTAVSSLPGVAHEAVLEQVYDEFGRFELLWRLAAECNVVGLKVSGKYGTIQSSSDDRSILLQYAKTGTWAERTNSLLQSFFADTGGNYIDIGANIGLTTIPVAQNPRVNCLAIEPEPRNFVNLCANIAGNCPHNNVEVRRLAVFLRRETLRFELASGNLGDHRLRVSEQSGQLGEDNRVTIDVEAMPLDEIVTNFSGPLAVKIDTQGAEPLVIMGGKETLRRAGLIVSEFWPYGMARLGGNPQDLIEFLRDHFSTLAVAINEEGPISPPRPAVEVCKELVMLVAAHSDDPEMYVDVIARR